MKLISIFLFFFISNIQADCWYSEEDQIKYDINLSGSNCTNRGYGWKLNWDEGTDWITFTGECCDNGKNSYTLKDIQHNGKEKGINWDVSSNISKVVINPLDPEMKWTIDATTIETDCMVMIGNGRDHVASGKEITIKIGRNTINFMPLVKEVVILRFTEITRPYIAIHGGNSHIRIVEDQDFENERKSLVMKGNENVVYQNENDTALSECSYLFNGLNVSVEPIKGKIIADICSDLSLHRYVSCPNTTQIVQDCSCYLVSELSEVNFKDFNMNYPDCFIFTTDTALTIKKHQKVITFNLKDSYNWKEFIFEERTDPITINSEKPIVVANVVFPTVDINFKHDLYVNKTMTLNITTEKLYIFRSLYVDILRFEGNEKDDESLDVFGNQNEKDFEAENTSEDNVLFLANEIKITNNVVKIGCHNQPYNRIIPRDSQPDCTCKFTSVYDKHDCEFQSNFAQNQLELIIFNSTDYKPQHKVYWKKINLTDTLITGDIEAEECYLNSIEVVGSIKCRKAYVRNKIGFFYPSVFVVEELNVYENVNMIGNVTISQMNLVSGSVFHLDAPFITINEIFAQRNSHLFFPQGVEVKSFKTNGYCNFTSHSTLIFDNFKPSEPIDVRAKMLRINSGLLNFNILELESTFDIYEQIDMIAINTIKKSSYDTKAFLNVYRSDKKFTITKTPKLISPENFIILTLSNRRQVIFHDDYNVTHWTCGNQLIYIGELKEEICSQYNLDYKVCIYNETNYLNLDDFIDYSCPGKKDPNVTNSLILENDKYMLQPDEYYYQIIVHRYASIVMENTQTTILLERDITVIGQNNSIYLKQLIGFTSTIEIIGSALLSCDDLSGFKVENGKITLSHDGICSVLNVNEETTYCAVCRYYRNESGHCLPPNLYNCEQFTSNGTCIQCSNGFYLENNSCHICSDQCQYCDEKECFICENRYELNTNNECEESSLAKNCEYNIEDNCYRCSIGSYQNSNFGCNQCMEHCNHCNNETTCQMCDISKGYFGSNCTYIENSVAMTSTEFYCKNGFYRKGNECVSCGDGCKYCQYNETSNEVKCLLCRSNDTKPNPLETNETESYYLLDNHSCKLNKGECEVINGLCSRCPEQDKYFNGSSCVSCGTHCSICGIDGTCLGCEKGYIRHSSSNLLSTKFFCNTSLIENCLEYQNGNCIQCTNGTYWDGNKCEKCHYSCASCTNYTSCLTCVEGFMIDKTSCISAKTELSSCNIFSSESTGECALCKDFYYRREMICKRCPQNCRTCQEDECLLCGSNYFLNETFQCESIFNLQGCLQYGEKGCTYCSEGLYLLKSRCVHCNQMRSHCENCNQTSGECFKCSEDYFVKNGYCVHKKDISCKTTDGIKCTSCGFWHIPNAAGDSCEDHIEWFVIFIIALIFIIAFLIYILIVMLLVIQKMHYKTKEKMALLGYCKVSQTNIKWKQTKIKDIVISKKKLRFGAHGNDELPIDQPSEDSFMIGNKGKDTKFITFGLRQGSEYIYKLSVEPQMVSLSHDDCIEVRIFITPLCTTIIEDSLEIIETNIKKCVKSTDSLAIKAKTQLSTRLDQKELILEKRIGEGAFGIVYKGKFRGNVVAIKNLKRIQILDVVVENFKLECQMLDKFRSDYIIHFYGCVLIPGKLGVVTEFAEFGSLERLIRDSFVEVKLRKKFLFDCSRGIQYLHNNGIMHRDIKPDNLLIVSMENDVPVNAKLTDFGSSKNVTMIQSNLTFTKQFGTPIYMAPEVLLKDYYKMPADIFSFGVMFFEVMKWEECYPTEMKSWEIAEFITQGKRLQKPADMKQDAYDLVCKMWCQLPQDRLVIDDVVSEIKKLE